jgi:two-component system LytT family sensor kinase
MRGCHSAPPWIALGIALGMALEPPARTAFGMALGTLPSLYDWSVNESLAGASQATTSVLVNALGHSAGVLIFGIFLYLLLQDRAARRLAGSTKSMLAAGLALLWNLASLLVLGTDPLGANPASHFTTVMAAVGFSVLSLLPAVLFDLCLQERFRVLVRLGYALSAATIALHVAELFHDSSSYHRWGLTLITIGFGALTCVAAAAVFISRDGDRRAATSRLVGTMSLFLLAMSFVHFRSGDVTQVWSRELAFHHAAIPLALLILMQDYRFVLLDAFLRFLANVLLAAMFTFGAVEAWRLDLIHRPATPFYQALLLAGACLVLIVFAMMRAGVQKMLTRLVFRRPDRDALLAKLKTPVRDEDEYLGAAAGLLGECMGAGVIDPARRFRRDGGDARGLDPNSLDIDLARPAVTSELLSRDRSALEREGVEAVVPLRLPARPADLPSNGSSNGARYVLLGRRSGGRRYLSEDLQVLGRAAGQIVEQVEQFRESEMRRLVAQAELRALQSQIHPHFLFNALNTLYGIIPREAKGARDTVLNLADIFRYFLETEKSFLPLEEELRIVRAYLEVERLRLGGKLRIEIDVEPEALLAPIPILSIQPLVENAVKHGIAPLPGGGMVRIEARIETRIGDAAQGEAQSALRVTVSDSGGGFAAQKSKSGVGMDNVNRRLQLCYGAEACLDIRSGSGGSSVSFAIPMSPAAFLQSPVSKSGPFEPVPETHIAEAGD